MEKYFINYSTGAGNEEYKGTLEGAMEKAEEGLAYTQESIGINNEDGDQVAYLPWYGMQPSDDDVVTCQFGSFGFYGEWVIE